LFACPSASASRSVNETPQSKPRTRKHRAKVVKEERPKGVIRKVSLQAVRSGEAAQSAVKTLKETNS